MFDKINNVQSSKLQQSPGDSFPANSASAAQQNMYSLLKMNEIERNQK